MDEATLFADRTPVEVLRAAAFSTRSGRSGIDEVVDEREVLRVECEKRDVVHVRGSCNHEVESSSPWLSAAAYHGCGEPSPLACDRRVDGKRIEGCLDDSEPLRATGALVPLGGNENAEVELGERGCADRTLEVAGALGTNQD